MFRGAKARFCSSRAISQDLEMLCHGKMTKNRWATRSIDGRQKVRYACSNARRAGQHFRATWTGDICMIFSTRLDVLSATQNLCGLRIPVQGLKMLDSGLSLQHAQGNWISCSSLADCLMFPPFGGLLFPTFASMRRQASSGNST